MQPFSLHSVFVWVFHSTVCTVLVYSGGLVFLFMAFLHIGIRWFLPAHNLAPAVLAGNSEEKKAPLCAWPSQLAGGGEAGSACMGHMTSLCETCTHTGTVFRQAGPGQLATSCMLLLAVVTGLLPHPLCCTWVHACTRAAQCVFFICSIGLFNFLDLVL